MAQVYSKDQLIEAYGHFFVLCYQSEGGFISKVYPGWQAEKSDGLVIWEFLGKPKLDDKNQMPGVLSWLTCRDVDQAVFQDFEAAKAKAEEIKLTEDGKKEFGAASLEIKCRLLPAEMKFLNPEQLHKGGKIFVVDPSIIDRPMTISEVELYEAELSPYQHKQSQDCHENSDKSLTWIYGQFKFEYGLKLAMFVPTGNDCSTLSECVLRYDPMTPDTFYYHHKGFGESYYFENGLRLCFTRKSAEEEAQRTALQAYRNIAKHLPRPIIPTAG